MGSTGRNGVLVAFVVAALVAVATACGTDGQIDGAASGSDDAGNPSSQGMPSVQAAEVGTDEVVDVGELGAAGDPVLVWFWAPHCPTCRTQAPVIEEFSERHRERVAVVGLGTRDDPDYAERFLADTGVTFPLLWERDGDAWRHFGITSQPAAVLVAPDGSWVNRWRGVVGIEELDAAVAEQGF